MEDGYCHRGMLLSEKGSVRALEVNSQKINKGRRRWVNVNNASK